MEKGNFKLDIRGLNKLELFYLYCYIENIKSSEIINLEDLILKDDSHKIETFKRDNYSSEDLEGEKNESCVIHISSTRWGENYIENDEIIEKDIGEYIAISGIEPSNKVENFISSNNFNSSYTVKVFDTNNTELKATDFLGTSAIVRLYDGETVVQEYSIIIYGDTTGDGAIDAFDALTLIKGVNNKVKFKSELHKEAGRIQATSAEEPTAIDALLIVKSANNKYTIEQSK